MSAEHDLETAIRRWREQLSAHHTLRADDLDELESHLRDELDALAEVGLEGEEAFAHATAKLGPARDLADEFARANPTFAWRVPALLACAGVLFHFLSRALSGYIDHAAIFVTTTLHGGTTVARVVSVLAVALPSVVAVALLLSLAPSLLTPPASRIEGRGVFGATVRIALVVVLALIVPVPVYVPFPPGLGLLDLAQGWSIVAWYEAAAPASRLVWRVTPFVLAIALVVARRRALGGSASAYATFWCAGGALAAETIGRVWRTSFYFSAWAAPALGVPADRLPVAVGVVIPVAIGLVAFLARPSTPRAFVESRVADVLGVAAACTSLVVSYWYTVLFTPSSDVGFVQIGHDAGSPLRVSVDVILPALLGVAILRLRSRLAETRLAD